MFSSTTTEHEWAWVGMRLVLFISHGMLLYECWTSRRALLGIIQSVSEIISSVNRVLSGKWQSDARLAFRLEELRIQKAYNLLRFLKVIIMILMLGGVCLAECQNCLNSEAVASMLHIQTSLGMCVVMYLCLTWCLSLPPTQHRIDCWYAFMSFMSICRVIITSHYGQSQPLIVAPLRAAMQTSISVVYMKWQVSCVYNLAYGLAIAWGYNRHQEPGYTSQRMLLAEMLLWSVTTVLCMSTESFAKEFLRGELAANDATAAAERLLSGLCDAVAHLTPELRFIQPTPKLMHLMCPTTPLSPDELEGVLFSSLLPVPSDKERFAAFVSASSVTDSSMTTKGAAPALHTMLHHPAGREVSVELFHVYTEGLDRKPQHLIGIREVRMDGISPDESLFLRSGHAASPSSPSGGDGRMAERKDIQRPTAKSNRSRGSSSLVGFGVPKLTQKRKLLGLDHIKVRFDDVVDFQINEYLLCFPESAQDDADCSASAVGRQNLKGCLVGQHSQKFMQWLQDGVQTLVYEDMEQLVFNKKLLFRPPTAACTSAKVVLCAESVTLIKLYAEAGDHDDDPVDEEDDSAGEAPLRFELQLGDVSQINVVYDHEVSSQKFGSQSGGSQRGAGEVLSALVEADDQADGEQ